MKKLIHLVATPASLFLFYRYVSTWIGVSHIPYSNTKPNVYRYLVPFLADSLMAFGIRYDIAFIAVIFLSFLGVFFSFYALYLCFDSNALKATAASYLVLWLMVLLTWYEKKIYDFMTVFLMTLLLALLARGKLKYYSAVFPLLCLNRETAFLLPLFFAVWYWAKMPLRAWVLWMAYQIIVFGAIQGLIHIAFAGLAGGPVLIRFMDNIRLYAAFPLGSALMALVLCCILWLVFRSWDNKPLFLRAAFVTWFPLVLIMHLVMGWSYEMRTLAEAYTVTCLLLMRW